MKFKIDENLPVEVCALLATAGHDATSVHEQRMGGAQDAQLAAVCKAEGRAILTLDHDFLDIRTYPPHEYSGIIAMKLQSQDKPHVLQTIRDRLIPQLAHEVLEGRLWIVDEASIRVRGDE
ncbi:MAG: DUF5615 family PIN-like protein [Tepidisphaeraceae bacterium]